MHFLQKKKQTLKFHFLNWLVCFISFTGVLLITLTLLVGNGKGLPFSHPESLRIPLAFFALLFFLSILHQYFYSKYNADAITELKDSIFQVEGEISSAIAPDSTHEMDITTISAVLNHSFESLNEKNLKLKSEIERNERLSENISEFYRQMLTLREADFKFDFFEYDINNSVFIFMSGMVVAIDDNVDLNEITGQSLFTDYNISVGYGYFLKQVNKSITKDIPIDLECSITGKDGNVRWLKFWGRPSKDRSRITGAISDITREVNERNIEKERAIHDTITGFYNRNALTEIAGKAIAEKAENEILAFVYVGLKGYKEFQDRFGMVAGNNYIRVGAEVFKKFMMNNLIPFRWWGSDFLILATGVKKAEDMQTVTQTIIDRIEKYVGEVDGIAVTFSLAVGYAVYGVHGQTPAELLEYASFAEHEALRGMAKSPNEFNRLRFEQARNSALRRTFIKDIIERNQLSVVFQPIVSLRTGELFGFEALSRPSNPIYTSIVELIEDAEASGNYVTLEKRMVYNALDAYMAQHEDFKDQYLFINTAPYATLDEKDYNDIRDRYFGCMKVVFEVVERNQMDPEEINLRKSIVTKAGAKFALDDFGTGYSNHLALLALEPDIIKIDRELVKGIDDDLRKQHMLEDIISYARYRGTRVLAEGVETKAELETLCRMGIDYAQGYFTGKPNPMLLKPDEKAQEVIRGISRNNQISMKQVFIIIEKSLRLVNKDLADNLAITSFLVLKLGSCLGYEGDRLAGLVITTMLHDIGVLFPGCERWRSGECEETSEHSIFTYLLLKEFFPYLGYTKAVLYHHKKFNGDNSIIENIAVPHEAYLLSLADSIAEIIKTNNSGDLHGIVEEKAGSEEFKPEHGKALKELCCSGLIDQIVSGDYQNYLLNYMQSLKAGKAEVEGIIRTFIYAVTFRSPFSYSHARTMETMASALARMTKQNWNLLEKVRIAALLYNLGMLLIDNETLKMRHTPKEAHELLSGALKDVSSIFREAELVDIMDMLNGVIGERNSSEKRMLMSKDIINGSNMLNLADIFSTLVEERNNQPGMTCQDILNELRCIAENGELYLPLVEMMGDYIEDIEARVSSNYLDITKRYQNIVSRFERLKSRISVMVD